MVSDTDLALFLSLFDRYYYAITIPCLFVFFVISLTNMITSLMSRMKLDMQLDGPKVSVLIPARDEEQNIERCLRSLANQTYTNYDIHVMDDASTDKTYAICVKLAFELQDEVHIIVHR